ncbi:glycosyltransferase family A protein [uncultured Shewanella sp.]|uniref:glycosyltransferase family A protein n=1 Tax=uncultured Shewanella sp. TaxID=173975 RepID=UPI00261C3E3A|nr:glycosyltransferase family A protein [uncultured Shewanella sp.]
MTAKFSIIIPDYNNSDLFLNILYGYAKQSYDNDQFEVMLIDNNFNCKNLVNCYHQYKDKFYSSIFFRAKFKSSFSLNLVRNIGVNTANNESTVFSDSGCIISPDFLFDINKSN